MSRADLVKYLRIQMGIEPKSEQLGGATPHQIIRQDQSSSGDEPSADPENSDSLKEIEDAIKAAKIDLKNYRNTLKNLKGLKHPQTRKREHSDLKQLVDEVVLRDQIPMPSEEDLALFDNSQTIGMDNEFAEEAESEAPSA